MKNRKIINNQQQQLQKKNNYYGKRAIRIAEHTLLAANTHKHTQSSSNTLTWDKSTNNFIKMRFVKLLDSPVSQNGRFCFMSYALVRYTNPLTSIHIYRYAWEIFACVRFGARVHSQCITVHPSILLVRCYFMFILCPVRWYGKHAGQNESEKDHKSHSHYIIKRDVSSSSWYFCLFHCCFRLWFYNLFSFCSFS